MDAGSGTRMTDMTGNRSSAPRGLHGEFHTFTGYACHAILPSCGKDRLPRRKGREGRTSRGSSPHGMHLGDTATVISDRWNPVFHSRS